MPWNIENINYGLIFSALNNSQGIDMSLKKFKNFQSIVSIVR